MADYFCTFCGCRHEPLAHVSRAARAAGANPMPELPTSVVERLRLMADQGDYGRKPDPTDIRRQAANTIEALVGALRDADALLTELLDGPSKGAFYGLERGTVMRGKIASIRAGVRKALALTSIDGGIG